MTSKSLPFGPIDSSNHAVSQILSKYDDGRHTGFIVHLDRSSCKRKRRAIGKACIINTGLCALILFLAAITVECIRKEKLAWSLWSALLIIQELLVVYASYSLLHTTLIPFYFGEIPYRMRASIRATEVVVRRAPTTSILSENEHLEYYQKFLKLSAEQYYTSIYRFIMSEQHCVSVYPAIMDIHHAIDKGEIQMEGGSFEPALWRFEDGSWQLCTLRIPEAVK